MNDEVAMLMDSLLEKHTEHTAVLSQAIGLLIAFIRQLETYPDVERSRRLYVDHQDYVNKLAKFEDLIAVLRLLGFTLHQELSCWMIEPRDVDVQLLKGTRRQLERSLISLEMFASSQELPEDLEEDGL